MILGFLFFIQTFLKHCKALSTEKDRRYRQIFIIIINNSKLNETKDQFRIRSTKRSNTEPVMAPEITHVTDFQRPYICLFEYTTSKFTLVSRRVIFSKPEKIITHLKFSRIQRPLHSECMKITTVVTFGRSFSALQRRTPSFFVSHVPLMVLYK